MSEITGTNEDDVLNGTDKPDHIFGLAGDDTINGNNGNDLLSGADGNDTLNGGAPAATRSDPARGGLKQTLFAKGLSPLTTVLQLQRSQAGLEGTLGELNGQVERAQATIAESRSSMKQIQDQRLQDVSNDTRDARTKLNEVEDRLRAAQDVAIRRDIVAPEDGTVLGMKVFNVGAVVRPGDPVMDLVPSHDRLVAEVSLSPNDIDVAYPGLKAQVRLPAFKQRLVPYLTGRVIYVYVAPDVTTDDQAKKNYYRTQIRIDRDQLARLPNVRLTPGMPVEAMVQLGQPSFFRYITQPIRDDFHRAFTEQ